MSAVSARDSVVKPRGDGQLRNNTMNLNLKIWRQKNPQEKGHFVSYRVENINPDMSFLEMLDVLNQKLIKAGDDPVAFDHDCREGICGSCAMVIDGNAHGPKKSTTTCQLYMRHYKNEDTIVIEPFRARAFPIVKDLVVNRQAFDRITQAGGYVSVSTGSAQDGNVDSGPKREMPNLLSIAAACIGCGACVKQPAQMVRPVLFVSAKVSHLALLPQGQPERTERVAKMIFQMDKEDFGSCTVMGSCAAACPKDIKLDNIARMNREFLRSMIVHRKPAIVIFL